MVGNWVGWLYLQGSLSRGMQHLSRNSGHFRFVSLVLVCVSAAWSPALAESLQRVNSAFNVPSSPPPTLFQLVPAFPEIAVARPTCIASPPGDTRHLFICEKDSGKI